MKRWSLVAFCLLLQCSGQADELWPGLRYDASIPTVEAVLGADVGERIVSHREMLTYFRALAAAAPQRMRLVEFGESWEGRSLIYAIVASREHMDRLDTLRERIQAMADPTAGTPDERAEWAGELPATVWLAYSVHGNEISGVNAAMITAYHLLAAQGDPVVGKILDRSIVFIEPAQNPDGRDRFVRHFRASLGLQADAKLDKGVNAAYFAGAEELLVSGYLWEENRRQLAYKPFTIVQTHGRGLVIAFTADPNFRAYVDGLNVLFMNAVFRGPAHARPIVPR